MVKKTIRFGLMCLIMIFSLPCSFDIISAQGNPTVTIRETLEYYFNGVAKLRAIPISYQYITLRFSNLPDDNSFTDALKKGVYMNLINNTTQTLHEERIMGECALSSILKTNHNLIIPCSNNKKLTISSLKSVFRAIPRNLLLESSSAPTVIPFSSSEIERASNYPLLEQAFHILKKEYLKGDELKDEVLIQGALKGMAEATGDKFTVYFPPVEAKNFEQELSGEFEGIGANVEMTEPGKLTVISPIVGSPAEKAGILPGDQVTKVNDFEITKDVSLRDAVARIRGAAGTSVKLTILRADQTLTLSVIRAKITIEYVEYKPLDNGDDYFRISLFGEGVADKFAAAVKTMQTKTKGGKIIIDLRNNPGGYLNESAQILSYFVPQGKPVIHIEEKSSMTDITSDGLNIADFSKRNIIFLVNEGSASASEIFVATMKDYYPNLRVLGEKTYGKGSVQSIDIFSDNSSIKYTTAKWFSGKTRTGIDHTGIEPDTIIKLDVNAMKKTNIDNQLEAAKNLVF
jgi:carboxyl-terminal processing protease